MFLIFISKFIYLRAINDLKFEDVGMLKVQLNYQKSCKSISFIAL